MADSGRASRLRQEIGRLATERAGIERQMLRPVRMMAASLIKRHLGTHAQKRASAAFYLSHLKEGRALNGVEVLRELAHLHRIAHCGKIVRTLREGLARGESLERTLDRLETQPPRHA